MDMPCIAYNKNPFDNNISVSHIAAAPLPPPRPTPQNSNAALRSNAGRHKRSGTLEVEVFLATPSVAPPGSQESTANVARSSQVALITVTNTRTGAWLGDTELLFAPPSEGSKPGACAVLLGSSFRRPQGVPLRETGPRWWWCWSLGWGIC